MHCDGNTLHLDGDVTMDTLPGIIDELRKLCDEGIENVDFAGVSTLDSAAIALALELSRRSEGRLRFRNVPPAARKLADLYSVSDQLAIDA